MDKAETNSYNCSKLDRDQSCDEKIRGLVDLLHAPEALKSKFDEQTESEYRKSKSLTLPPCISPQSTTNPPWLDELSIRSKSSNGDIKASSTNSIPTLGTEIEERKPISQKPQISLEMSMLRVRWSMKFLPSWLCVLENHWSNSLTKLGLMA